MKEVLKVLFKNINNINDKENGEKVEKEWK